MKKQIVIATVAGALVAGAGLLWTQPAFSATNDVRVAFSPDGGAEQLVLRMVCSTAVDSSNALTTGAAVNE